MIRLFVGLALPAELAGRLETMEAGIPGARWVEARNLHITLRFIGEVEEGVAHDIHDALAELVAPAFDVEIRGVGLFGGRAPHALYAGVERSDALVRLRDKVESAVVRTGQPPEPRKFTPHVTLARLKNAPAPRLQAFLSAHGLLHAAPWRADDFTLFRSHLGRTGAEYEAVARYPLA
ncbi:MAG: RNA 2',3'-cyclic phosphodiesterase [Actinomycetota bacterium]